MVDRVDVDPYRYCEKTTLICQDNAELQKIKASACVLDHDRPGRRFGLQKLAYNLVVGLILC
jgi:hypothetical protein